MIWFYQGLQLTLRIFY